MAIITPKRKLTNSLRVLPSGSFSVDSSGNLVSTTVGQAFPRQHLENIATAVLQTFRSAEEVALPLIEFSAIYGAFKITARELKGGAIVFLSTTERVK